MFGEVRVASVGRSMGRSVELCFLLESTEGTYAAPSILFMHGDWRKLAKRRRDGIL